MLLFLLPYLSSLFTKDMCIPYLLYLVIGSVIGYGHLAWTAYSRLWLLLPFED